MVTFLRFACNSDLIVFQVQFWQQSRNVVFFHLSVQNELLWR